MEMERRLIDNNLHGPSSCFDGVFLTLSCGSSSSSSSFYSSSSSSEPPAAAASTPPAPVLPRGRRRSRRRLQQAPSPSFECRTCGRDFPTFQALGGHRTSHLRRPPAAMLSKKKKKKARPSEAAVVVHACAACGLGFSTGQALGGHMRRHRRGSGPRNTCTAAEEDELGSGGPDAGYAVDLARAAAVVLDQRPSSAASLQLLDLFRLV